MQRISETWQLLVEKQPVCLIKLWGRSCEIISQREKITDKTNGRINTTLGGYFSLSVCDWQDPDSAPYLIKNHHIIPAVSQYLNINTVVSPHPSLPDRHSPLMSFITMMKQWQGMEGWGTDGKRESHGIREGRWLSFNRRGCFSVSLSKGQHSCGWLRNKKWGNIDSTVSQKLPGK